jgi:pimeloyl-ACP methyl ester carboxylesterase
MRCTPARLLATGAALALSLPLVHAQRVPLNPSDTDTFTAEGLQKGVHATAEQCATLPQAVWARTGNGTAECIRYWVAGPRTSAPISRVLVYIPSDQMAFDRPDAGYTGRSPQALQGLADAAGKRLGVPYILLSRPGIFGSSGEHAQRRRELEPRLMNAALDELKARHGIAEFVLVGLSGGGHVVASLLGWRSDIACAVPASAVSSPRLRWQGLGRSTDLTGFADSYEPIDHLPRGAAAFHPKLRVFVLGDPKDGNVPWSTQTPLATRLKQAGVATELLTGEGSDSQRHVLGASAQQVGAMCLKDQPTPEIQDAAARGLKG